MSAGAAAAGGGGAAAEEQEAPQVRVYVDMVADLFHWGHVRFLKRAREQAPVILLRQLPSAFPQLKVDLAASDGDEPVEKADSPFQDSQVTLVVGIHSDGDVATYKRRPVMSMTERAEVISACKYVDEVVLDAPLRVTKDHLRKHSIDVVCHAHVLADDERYRFMYEGVPEGRFVRIDPSPVSTTDVIGRIQLRTSLKTLKDESERVAQDKGLPPSAGF